MSGTAHMRVNIPAGPSRGDAAACGSATGGFARGLKNVDCAACRATPAFLEAMESFHIEDLASQLPPEDLRRFVRILWHRVPNARKANAISAFRAGGEE